MIEYITKLAYIPVHIILCKCVLYIYISAEHSSTTQAKVYAITKELQLETYFFNTKEEIQSKTSEVSTVSTK